MTMGEKNHFKHDSDRIQRKDDTEIAKLVAEKLEIYLNFERRENYFDTNGTLRVTPRMYGTDRAYASLERKEFDQKTRKQQREDRKNKLKSDEPYISPRLDPDALVTSREAQYLIDAANEIYIKTPVNKLQVIHRYRPTSNRKNIAANGKVHNFVKHVGAVLKSDDYCKYYVDRRLCGHWCLSAQTDNENSPRNCESKTDDEQEKMGKKDELEIDSGRPSGGESKDTVLKKTSQDNGDNCEKEGDKEMTKKPNDIRTSESSNSGGNDARKKENKNRNNSLSSKSQSRSRSRSRSSSDSRSRSSRSNSRDHKGKRANDSEYVEGENDKSTRMEHRGQLLKVIIRNTKPRRKSSKKKKTENFRECNSAMMSENERMAAGKRMNSGSDGKRRTVAEPRYLSYTTGRDRTPFRASSAASPKSSRSPRHQTVHQSRGSGGISAWRDPTGRPRSSADEEYHKYSPYSQSVITVKKSLHRQF